MRSNCLAKVVLSSVELSLLIKPAPAMPLVSVGQLHLQTTDSADVIQIRMRGYNVGPAIAAGL